MITAHSPIGIKFSEFANDPLLYRPIIVKPPADLMLSQLLYAIARQPEIRQTIHRLYADQIANSGILRTEPVGDLMRETIGNTFAGPEKLEFSKRLSAGDISSVVELFAYEIGPTFLFPTPNRDTCIGSDGIFFMLLEALLYFVLYPKSAKFIAYELCNRIRECLKKLDPGSWSTYVRDTGYTHGRQGSDMVLKRNEYLFNLYRPAMLYGPAQNRGWQVVSRISNASNGRLFNEYHPVI